MSELRRVPTMLASPAASKAGVAEDRMQQIETRSTDHLESLDRLECLLRLGSHGVGRVGITIDGLPRIYPVNYTLSDGMIVIRTRHGGDVAVGTDDTVVAFEIDGADNLYHEGWSVLVVGRASHITDPEILEGLTRLPLTPWAGDNRWCFVTVAIDEVTGRHLHHRTGPATPNTMAPRRLRSRDGH